MSRPIATTAAEIAFARGGARPKLSQAASLAAVRASVGHRKIKNDGEASSDRHGERWPKVSSLATSGKDGADPRAVFDDATANEIGGWSEAATQGATVLEVSLA